MANTKKKLDVVLYDATIESKENVFMIDKNKRTNDSPINVECAINLIDDETLPYYNYKAVINEMEKEKNSKFQILHKKTTHYAIPIAVIMELIDLGIVDISPSYQRNFIKTNVEKSEIVCIALTNHQSLGCLCLVRVPYKKPTDKGAWELWDGKQRITSIKEFINNVFSISKTNTALDGYTYGEIIEKFPEMNTNFKNVLIDFEITHESSHKDIVKMFSNVNSEQTTMTQAEGMHSKYANNTLFKRVHFIVNDTTDTDRFDTINAAFKRTKDDNRFATTINCITAIAINESVNNTTSESPFKVHSAGTCNSIAYDFLEWTSRKTDTEINSIVGRFVTSLQNMQNSLPNDMYCGYSKQVDDLGRPLKSLCGNQFFPDDYERFLHSNRNSLVNSILAVASFSAILKRKGNTNAKIFAKHFDIYLQKLDRQRTNGARYVSYVNGCNKALESVA